MASQYAPATRPKPNWLRGMVATQASGRPTYTKVDTRPARFRETASAIEPNSHSALVSGASTLNIPRSAGDSLLAPAVTRRLVERFVSRPPPDTARRERFEELTDRELEVLRLMTRGLSNAEIGELLFLSEATVKTHVTRVLSKLGVRDRVQAVVLAYESGLVEPGEGTD